MGGFRTFMGISGRQSAAIILSALCVGAVLFSSGCAGVVHGGSSNGGPGSLAISNVAATNLSVTGATVSWQTNLAANSQVEYGTTSSYGATTPMDSTMVTAHQETLAGLKPGTLYHYRVHSTDANNNPAVSGDLTLTTTADTAAPAVAITAPAANAAISGTVNLMASASDNVAVASVQFKVDNANTGAAISAVPYIYALNTALLSDGNHILTAMATDTSGNSATSLGVAVKVNNTTPAPSITSVNPASGLVGASVAISGANFGAIEGTSSVTFNGVAAVPATWSAASIVLSVPAGATTGNVVVTVGGAASNGVNFTVTVPAPSIASLNPSSGLVGTSVTIGGANFGAAQGTSAVNFNGIAAAPTNWSAASIVVPVPVGATAGNVLVTVGGVASNGVNFTVTAPGPSIASLNPASGFVGASVTISGANFGASQGTSTVTFNGIAAVPTSWNTTSIVVPVPAGATTGNVVVAVGGVASNGASFTVTAPAPSITSLNPSSGLVGTSVTIGGANFGAAQGTSAVNFNGIAAAPTNWSAASIVVPVPVGATAGNVLVTVGGVPSNGVNFTVTAPGPSIASMNPSSGFVGTSVTVTGANFGATQGTSSVNFNGIAAAPASWSATSIVVPVPAGATTGNVQVTVGGVASNGVSFTVQTDTTAPVVTITAPANNATVSGTITLTATATDVDSAVSFVQFQVDGTNTGGQVTSAPYSLPLDTTTLSNGLHTLKAIAKDPAGNQGTSAPAVTITVSNVAGTGATGPLRALAGNANYFTDGSGKAILLTGSQTWDSFQDMDQSSSPAALNFTAYVNFLKAHGHNVTILWRKDLPTFCNWGAGGTWHVKQFPWKRTGGSSGNQVASDGLPAFDLTQLDQTYFDRLRARVIQLQQNGIYAVVELFDGLELTNNRCANDGYPFTGGNNVNGVDDGGGEGSMTMNSPNAITGYQDAFVQKAIDTVNDQPNVLWEPSEEAPDFSTWWQGHMISLIHTYEAGKPHQHPVGYASLNVGSTSDSILYDSNADWVAPHARTSPTSSCGSGTPACKVNINDSDHSYFGMWNDSAQANRNYVWENFANGNSVMFMDPYVIYWPNENRNLCPGPSNGVCSGPDARWNNMRDNLGYTLNYANKMDLAKMTPHGSVSSTGFCLAQTPSVGAEYLVYAPNGGTFTVDLSAMSPSRTLNVEWFDPGSGTTTSGAAIAGGSTKSFAPPFGGDAILYLVDAAGHN